MLGRSFACLCVMIAMMGCAPAPAFIPLTGHDPQNPVATESPMPTPDDTLAVSWQSEPPALAADPGGLMPDMSGSPKTRPATRPDEAAALSATRQTPLTRPSTTPIDPSIADPSATPDKGAKR